MRTDFDAVVIGGGPAGACAARRLALLGWHTALIERRPRYRSKTCGHCLNPRAFPLLDREGLFAGVRAIAEGSTHRLRVHHHGRNLDVSIADRKAQHAGLIVDRRRFDQFLIDQAAEAGVHIFQPATARMQSSQAVVLRAHRKHLVIHTALTIGADGLGSAVARFRGLASPRDAGRKYGFSFAMTTPWADMMNRGVIEMFIVPGGYLGMVNQGGGRLHMAGLVAPMAMEDRSDPISFIRLAAQRHARLQRLGVDAIERSQMLQFTAAGPMPWQPRKVADRHVVLVGDAAGYIEPFTGEGMTWAIESADALGEALANDEPGAWSETTARRYTGAWKKRINARQRWCQVLAFLLARPRVAEWGLRASVRFPALPLRVIHQVVAT